MKSICKVRGQLNNLVAPARERGLKSDMDLQTCVEADSRSREGAWIEIGVVRDLKDPQRGRSREGAWIEIST